MEVSWGLARNDGGDHTVGIKQYLFWSIRRRVSFIIPLYLKMLKKNDLVERLQIFNLVRIYIRKGDSIHRRLIYIMYYLGRERGKTYSIFNFWV
ncbi:hypothetical protein MIMGU_mgv1a017097mg [Erythranthe guttata]|uniref:Uncharacterized protein n=1 Tax=Erythranthe guttata TaxID=4155 RepID=A0A022RIH6_ERYGU|nr:hypothetical protein MIMGU_mgv1a017097mg [Erythranthe guttata]